MDDERYTIRWYATGDVERGLTRGDVIRAAAANACEWAGGYIVASDGRRVGVVVREDY